jgi:isocitrate lyase
MDLSDEVFVWNSYFTSLVTTLFITAQIDNFETHVVPIIADIDAGFGNEEATYLLAIT